MKTLNKKTGVLAVAILGLFMFTTSCRKQSVDTSAEGSVDDSLTVISPTSGGSPSTGPTTDTYSHVQFVNANPSIGPLTLTIAGVKNGAGLNTYGDERGYYNTTASVPREPVVITSANGNTVKSTSSGFYAWQYYSVFYVGEISNQQLLLFNDARPITPPSAGTAYVKFVDAAPASPLIDVVLNNTTVVSRQGFKANTPYVTVNAGTYNVNFNVSGTSTAAANIPAAVLLSGKAYTVYLKDNIQGGKVTIAADIYTVE